MVLVKDSGILNFAVNWFCTNSDSVSPSKGMFPVIIKNKVAPVLQESQLANSIGHDCMNISGGA